MTALEKTELEYQMITVKQIALMLSMNQNHVRDRVTRRADFPKAYRIGGAKRWLLAEIVEWLGETKK